MDLENFNLIMLRNLSVLQYSTLFGMHRAVLTVSESQNGVIYLRKRISTDDMPPKIKEQFIKSLI